MAKSIQKLDSQIVVNSFKDEGDGVVSFPKGLTIIDNSKLWSGASYDIKSLKVDEYPGQVTADHTDKLANIIGKVEGVRKVANRVVVDKIIYAVNISATARLAYDLMVNGFSPAFSVETIGPWLNDENQYKEHTLSGLSQVVVGNCKKAKAYDLIKNSISASQDLGLETDGLQDLLSENEGESVAKVEENPKAEEEIVETIVETEEVEKTEEVEEIETEVETTEEKIETEATGETEEVVENSEASEEEIKEELEATENEIVEEAEKTEVIEEEPVKEAEEVETKVEEIKEETEEATEVPAEEEETETKEPAEEEVENKIKNKLEEKMTKEEILKLVNEAIATIATADEKAPVEEPELKEVEEIEEVENNWQFVYEKQVNTAARASRTKSINALQELEKINERNFNALKKEGLIKNSITIESFGNFVLPPEMYRRILGDRTDYTAVIDATNWREIDRLDFAYLTRQGDIEMRALDSMCDDGNDGNVKLPSEYGAVQTVGQLEEFAATTPICSAATKFLAVDLMNDALEGYRNSYDKIRAAAVIYRLQEAVNKTDNKVAFAPSSDVEAIKTFLEVLAEISDSTTTGKFVFTQKTLLKIKAYALSAGVNGPLGEIFITGSVPTIFGVPYLIVSNDLMPSLGDAGTNPIYTFNGEAIEITSTVFYGSLTPFVGYTSGGLNLTVADGAAYEVTPGVTRSGFSRDELVLRGYAFIGSAYREPSKVAAIVNDAISS